MAESVQTPRRYYNTRDEGTGTGKAKQPLRVTEFTLSRMASPGVFSRWKKPYHIPVPPCVLMISQKLASKKKEKTRGKWKDRHAGRKDRHAG